MKRRQQTPRPSIGLRADRATLRDDPQRRRPARSAPASTLDGARARRAASAPRIAGPVAGGRAGRDAAPAQHGHDRRQPLPRHALHLLRPELRVAPGDRLLHEEGRRDLLGRDVEPALPGGVVDRHRADAAGARRDACTLVSARGERAVAVADLYANDGMHYLTRRPDEILTDVAFPTRTAGAAPTGNCGAAARSTSPSPPPPSRRGSTATRVDDARIVLGAVASRPLASPNAPQRCSPDQRLTDEAIAAAADAA